MGTFAVSVAQGRRSFHGRRRPVLDGVNLDVERGEMLAIVGSSGSGKSTLLRIIAGLDALDSGTIQWDGETGDGRPRTGVVFQKPLLLPWLTVRENIHLGGRFTANADVFDPAYADGLLDRFGLAEVVDSFPDELSGGQAQRVAVIRAVSIKPRLLLLDEPFSALDPAIRGDLQHWLAGVAEELGCTTILVTHDIDEAVNLGHRIVLIGEGGTVRREWDCSSSAADTEALRGDILSAYRTSALVGAP
ncbi:sulfate transport system ATP-binding protein/sulfonate transport system ATP-binding protein [Rhodococcus sp. OK519]|uniref:ABC transporter ATP-binding protein n=1 Tax=Rhodococcus sp. OK519 TaxID=2135729 RepID=UPI000D34CBF3|nr:sulfate transport system ATP-binding protein/sulfonate transport system ATP-binding protein [Rhodococcus sp. OK519]